MDERFLICGETASESSGIASTLKEAFPECSVDVVDSPARALTRTQKKEFDLILLGEDVIAGDYTNLIAQFRLQEHDPLVVLLVDEKNSLIASEAHKLGANRCLIHNATLQNELPSAVRHLLRLRKLEAENRRLVTKLTEANALLEEKNRRLDDFSATLAHDIRGPLGAVSMKLDFLLDRYGETLDKRCSEMMTRALSTTERLTALVQAMYEYARLGAKAAKMSELSLDEVVEGVVSDLNIDPKREVKIHLTPLPMIWGNRELLVRAFTNLLNNAIKYNDKPETVISIKLAAEEERTLGRFAIIEISDNGPGIALEDQERIFSMFSRGTTSAATSDGLGVGLAVVKRVAELHYGDVVIRSEKGQGTSFSLSLPLEQIEVVKQS